jgi:hypothetical protein
LTNSRSVSNSAARDFLEDIGGERVIPLPDEPVLYFAHNPRVQFGDVLPLAHR